MIRQVNIKRDGEELGAWPFDVVFSLVRSGSLLPTDTFWADGMDEWKPLSEAIPPSPSRTKSAIFVGRADEECAWMFYCRDGCTVIGPRPMDEMLSLMMLGVLTDDDLVFITLGDRWDVCC
jgi:hypothetical protein